MNIKTDMDCDTDVDMDMSMSMSVSRSMSVFMFIFVPDRRRRIHLEVVLVRRWEIWVLGIWKGRVWGKGGSRGVSLQAT